MAQVGDRMAVLDILYDGIGQTGRWLDSLPGPLAAEPYAVQAYLSALNGELEKVLKLSLPGGDWRMKKIGTLAAGMARANTLVRRELALEMAKGAGEGERDELILLAGNLTALLRRLKE